MSNLNKTTIDGVDYLTKDAKVPEGSLYLCTGCVAEDNTPLCGRLPRCTAVAREDNLNKI